MTLRMRVVSADGRRFEHDVEGDEVIVGRSSRAGLALADRAMSREHARIRQRRTGLDRRGPRLAQRDAAERSPRRGGPRALRDGDTISLGGSVLTVEIQGEEGSPSGDSVIYRSARDLLQSASGSTDVSGVGASGKKAADRLHMLNEVNQALASSISLEELLELILDRAFVHLKPQEGAIYLRDAAGNDVCAARRSTPGRESRPMHSQEPPPRGHRQGDGGARRRLGRRTSASRRAESLMMSGLRSFIAAPLLDAQGALGMIVVGAALGVQELPRRGPRAPRLPRVGRRAADPERAARRRGDGAPEARAGGPPGAPDPGRAPARHAPAGPRLGAARRERSRREGSRATSTRRSCAGDGTDVAFFVADVSGKGIAASLLTASLEALSALPLEGNDPPDGICEKVGTLLFQRTPPEKYATAFLGILEPSTGRLRWTNAGHNPALLLRASGEAEWLKSNGVPLGLLPGAPLQGRGRDDGPGRRPPRLHRRDHRGAGPRGGGVRRDRARGSRFPPPGTCRSAKWRPASNATSTRSPAESPSTTTGRS